MNCLNVASLFLWTILVPIRNEISLVNCIRIRNGAESQFNGKYKSADNMKLKYDSIKILRNMNIELVSVYEHIGNLYF